MAGEKTTKSDRNEELKAKEQENGDAGQDDQDGVAEPEPEKRKTVGKKLELSDY